MRCFSVFCLLRDKFNTIATLGQAVDHIRAREAIEIKQTRTCTHMHIPASVEYTVRKKKLFSIIIVLETYNLQLTYIRRTDILNRYALHSSYEPLWLSIHYDDVQSLVGLLKFDQFGRIRRLEESVVLCSRAAMSKQACRAR